MIDAAWEKLAVWPGGNRVFPLRVGFGGMINYSYIIHDPLSGLAAVVDPAWELERILRKLEELDADLSTILLTHSHPDHVDLVIPLVERFDATVVISQSEQEHYRFSCQNLYPVDHLDEIRLGNTVITCLLTPGHTAGGMCYLLPDGIFTGDTVFIEGCGICSTPGGSAQEMFESIQMLRRTVPTHVLVYPGHCYGEHPGKSFELLQQDNIYFHFDRKDMFVDFRMRRGQKNLFSFR